MRLSTMPFSGTVSALRTWEYSRPQHAIAATVRVPALSTVRGLWVMVALLRSRLFDQDFGFGPKIDDLEAERIPATRFRILRGFRIRELNGRHPVRKRLLASGALPRRF